MDIGNLSFPAKSIIAEAKIAQANPMIKEIKGNMVDFIIILLL